MAPSLLFDINEFDLQKVSIDAEGVEKVIPHRGHMRMLDGVFHLADDFSHALGYHDVRNDEFWVEGHIPGRPILPGVMMIETAAQLASFVMLNRIGAHRFIGFTGTDNVRFRGQVVPGDRLYILVVELKFSPRRFVCASQGIVNGQIVFEATIKGMPI
jgi:3-hydroxyacyl-[acyl-carrier-protein] dehydratase